MLYSKPYLKIRANNLAYYSAESHKAIMNGNENSYNCYIGRYIEIANKLERFGIEVIDNIQSRNITLKYGDIEVSVDRFKYFK